MRDTDSAELADLQKEMAELRVRLRSVGVALLQCEGRLADYLRKHGRRKRRVDLALLVKEIIRTSDQKGASSKEIYDRLIETNEFMPYGTLRTLLSRMNRRGEITGQGSSSPMRWTIPAATASEATGEGQ
jgi:hypothetical protein